MRGPSYQVLDPISLRQINVMVSECGYVACEVTFVGLRWQALK